MKNAHCPHCMNYKFYTHYLHIVTLCYGNILSYSTVYSEDWMFPVYFLELW